MLAMLMNNGNNEFNNPQDLMTSSSPAASGSSLIVNDQDDIFNNDLALYGTGSSAVAPFGDVVDYTKYQQQQTSQPELTSPVAMTSSSWGETGESALNLEQLLDIDYESPITNFEII